MVGKPAAAAVVAAVLRNLRREIMVVLLKNGKSN